MEQVIEENDNLKKALAASMKRNFLHKAEETEMPPVRGLLKLLLDCAKSNAGKKPGGLRYFNTIKEFGTLVYTIGGFMTYEILAHNLPLPSVSKVRAKLSSQDLICEGDFRFSELHAFLEKRNLPKRVWCAEDGTRIVQRIQYCSKTNQVMGFVPPLDENGVPVVGNFPATSAQVMKTYFENEKSSTAYCVMAQPLSNDCPTFCLALYGTENKFNAHQVVKRWTWTVQKSQESGIEVVGISGDGDGKILRAMLYMSVVAKPDIPRWSWFSCTLSPELIFIQDTIHLVTKLKSRLVGPSMILPMGKMCFASRGHLIELINNNSKDLHQLTLDFINGKDKMNYRAVQLLCDKKVTDLLRQPKIKSLEATATYLDMIREILIVFTDCTISPLERICMMWKWVFFVRLWRIWISKTPGYTLANNFITSNSYSCIEINAHALIQVVRKFRDDEEPQLFLPWLMSSQPCEKFFGHLRSMTSTQSTQVNFSILECQHRVRRADFISESKHNLKGVIEFPREKRKMEECTSKPVFYPTLPEDYEIEQTVLDAFKIALKTAEGFGMAPRSANIPKSFLPYIPLSELVKKKSQRKTYDEDLSDSDGEEGLTEAETCDEIVEEESSNNVMEDLMVVSTGSLGLRSYAHVPLTQNSPFVLVMDSKGKPAAIRKSSFLYLCSSGDLGTDLKLSSDRLLRVMQSTRNSSLIHKKTSINLSIQKEDYVSIGDWCAFRSEDLSIAVGRIEAFRYLSGSTWKNQEYSDLTAPTKPPPKKARGLGVLCSWYSIVKGNKLKATSMDIHGFYDISHYLCTLPRPDCSDHGNTIVSRCSEKQISIYLNSIKK